MTQTTTDTTTSSPGTRQRKLAARAAQFSTPADEQVAVGQDGAVAGSLASQPASQSASQQDAVQDVKNSSKAHGSAAAQRRRKPLVDTAALMDELRDRKVDEFTKNKAPMNGSIDKDLIMGLEEFCRRHEDRTGKPMPRYLVLSKLIEQLLAGEER